jgi:protein-S-isoprenylcysteine O-methyltransferase Ste14
LRSSRSLPWDLLLPVGLILLIGARIQFKKNDSEIMTFDEPRNLVTTGFFGFSRNPMYLGFTILLLAAALYVNTACALLAPIVFFITANWWYIPYEEVAAKKAFGSDYTNYIQRVRRWI